MSKGPGSEVLSGSSVVAGHGTAQVVRVGADSFARKLTAEAKRFSMVNSEIRNSLNRILRWITWLLFPVMFLVINGGILAIEALHRFQRRRNARRYPRTPREHGSLPAP